MILRTGDKNIPYDATITCDITDAESVSIDIMSPAGVETKYPVDLDDISNPGQIATIVIGDIFLGEGDYVVSVVITYINGAVIASDNVDVLHVYGKYDEVV